MQVYETGPRHPANPWNGGRWRSQQNVLSHLVLVSAAPNSSGICGDLTECHVSASHLEVNLTPNTSNKKSWSFCSALCALADPTHWLTFGGKKKKKWNEQLTVEGKQAWKCPLCLAQDKHTFAFPKMLKKAFLASEIIQDQCKQTWSLTQTLWQGKELAHSDLWVVYQINKLTVSLLSPRPSVRCGSVVGGTWQD